MRHLRITKTENPAAFASTPTFAFAPAFTRAIGPGPGGSVTDLPPKTSRNTNTDPSSPTDSPPLSTSIIVLKFGGGLLRSADDTHLISHEIYRWIRRGWRVVAVVSALGETTDALTTLAASAGSATPHPEALASVLSTGELTSAGLLALALDRAGIPVEVLDAARLSLRTRGDLTDSTPESVDVGTIHGSLARVPVVVVPGFVGRDSLGRTSLLGRGGSDLTAVFLAAALGARCRLLKDVPGLFDRPPANTRPRTLLNHNITSANTTSITTTSISNIGGTGAPPVQNGPVTTHTQHAPSQSADVPHLFHAITYDDALTLSDRVVQHKAVRFARDCGQVYEVAAPFAVDATIVGARRTIKSPITQPQTTATPLAITILGAGTVAGGVYQSLRQLIASNTGPLANTRITSVATRTLDRARALSIPDSILSTDPIAAAESNFPTAHPNTPRLVIELIGGTNTALHAVRAALRSGAHVITANKALIAAHGEELHQLARLHNVSLRYSASVGGALPVLETARRLAADTPIARIEAVLNGTSNFILDRTARNTPFTTAVQQAIDAGFAEADPSRDLLGLDALDKARLLALAAFPHATGFVTDEIQPISAETLAQHTAPPQPPNAATVGTGVPPVQNGPELTHTPVARAAENTHTTRAHRGTLRHLVELSLTSRGVRCSIRLHRLDDSHPAARIRDEANAVRFTLATGRTIDITGKGAGRWPTTQSVIADTLDTLQSLTTTPTPTTESHTS